MYTLQDIANDITVIKKFREEQSLSISAMATRNHLAYDTLIAIEKGRNKIKLDDAVRIVEFMNMF